MGRELGSSSSRQRKHKRQVGRHIRRSMKTRKLFDAGEAESLTNLSMRLGQGKQRLRGSLWLSGDLRWWSRRGSGKADPSRELRKEEGASWGHGRNTEALAHPQRAAPGLHTTTEFARRGWCPSSRRTTGLEEDVTGQQGSDGLPWDGKAQGTFLSCSYLKLVCQVQCFCHLPEGRLLHGTDPHS